MTAQLRRLTSFVDSKGLSARDLAARLRLPPAQVEALLAGRAPITEPIARQLSAVTGDRLKFWLGAVDLGDPCQRWEGRRDRYRAAGERINPADYRVDRIASDRTAREYVEARHYSASYPAALERIGLYRVFDAFPFSELVGVAVFSVPASQAVITAWTGLPPDGGAELGRFVLNPEVPGNGESWFLARAFELLRQSRPKLQAVISASDPLIRGDVCPGHVGVIYQALNGQHVGRTRARRIFLDARWRTFSDRALSKIRDGGKGARYAAEAFVAAGAPPRLPGESPADWIARGLPALRSVRHPGCLMYRWPLVEGAALKPMDSLPYPRLDQRVVPQTPNWAKETP